MLLEVHSNLYADNRGKSPEALGGLAQHPKTGAMSIYSDDNSPVFRSSGGRCVRSDWLRAALSDRGDFDAAYAAVGQ
jgi:hypothetical protein